MTTNSIKILNRISGVLMVAVIIMLSYKIDKLETKILEVQLMSLKEDTAILNFITDIVKNANASANHAHYMDSTQQIINERLITKYNSLP